MASLKKIKSKKFKFKKDATEWAKKQKEKMAGEVKFETNFLQNAPESQKWEAVIYKRF